MLLCKRTCCLWYLVYIDCSSTTRRPSGRPQERDHRHGQDCCNRICPQHAAARPPLRCDRSRADGLGQALAAQRRPAPLRPLRTSVPTLLQASIKFPPRLVAPVRRGPFFCPQFASEHFVLRQIRLSDTMARLDGLPAGIPHTKLAALAPPSERSPLQGWKVQFTQHHWAVWRDRPQGASSPWFPDYPKDADAACAALSYNSRSRVCLRRRRHLRRRARRISARK